MLLATIPSSSKDKDEQEVDGSVTFEELSRMI